MDDYWKATKKFFIWAIICLLFNFLFAYLGSIDGPISPGFMLFLFSPTLISLFFCMLTINFGIKSLKTGEKKSWYLIIISGILTLIYISIIIISILDSINRR